jgi:hypothetical protein
MSISNVQNANTNLESDYEKRLDKSEYDYIYITCKNKKCGVKIGLTTDMMGDVVVWLKSEEKELLNEVQII